VEQVGVASWLGVEALVKQQRVIPEGPKLQLNSKGDTCEPSKLLRVAVRCAIIYVRANDPGVVGTGRGVVGNGGEAIAAVTEAVGRVAYKAVSQGRYVVECHILTGNDGAAPDSEGSALVSANATTVNETTCYTCTFAKAYTTCVTKIIDVRVSFVSVLMRTLGESFACAASTG
jgi:hypothetical protein